MDPMTLMTLSSMAPSAGSLGLGLYQLIRGSMIKEDRPTYETPQEITQNVAMRQATGVSAGQGQMNRGLLALAQQEAQDYQRRISGLEQARGVAAQYRDREFDINEFQPYQEAMRAKAALTSAGLQNLYTGSSDMSGTLGQGYSMGAFQPQPPQPIPPTAPLQTQQPQPIPQNFQIPSQYINYNPGLMFGLRTAY